MQSSSLASGHQPPRAVLQERIVKLGVVLVTGDGQHSRNYSYN